LALAKPKFREAVFQILFCLDTGHAQKEKIIELMMGELKITKKATTKAYEEAMAVYEKIEALDDAISCIATSYSIQRIQRVEKNILRLGVYELLYQKKVPPLVSISEAIRLTNKFSTKEAGKFINAILDAVLKKGQGEKVDLKEIKNAFTHLEETGLGRDSGN